MSDVLETILSRRSIRKYTKRIISENHVRRMLDVLMRSPSAADARPWHFVIVDRRGLLDRMGRELDHCEMLLEATLGILVCGDPSLEKIPGFWPQDCAAATENLLIAVNALKFGGVWIGLYPIEERMAVVRRALGIPKKMVPFALASIGYPAERLPPEDRYNARKVHRNGW